MKNKDFYSKILLFGEYGIIKNFSGLSIPFKEFNGTLKLNDKLNGKAEESNLEIQKFSLMVVQVKLQTQPNQIEQERQLLIL